MSYPGYFMERERKRETERDRERGRKSQREMILRWGGVLITNIRQTSDRWTFEKSCLLLIIFYFFIS